MKNFKLYCLSASVITALLMAISVFFANVGHTEYKSQMRKRKLRKQDLVSTTTQDNVIDDGIQS